MDKLLLDNLIDIVINDNDNKNTYDKFDKLLSTFSNDEITYFLSGCGDYAFKNLDLFTILLENIPHIFTDYLNTFIDNKLKEVDESQYIIEEEYRLGLITKEDYISIIESYNDVRSKALNLKLTYIFEILQNLNK